MRFRIGYGGPKNLKHGVRSGRLSELERFLHLIVSLQILFGSRRGGLLFPLIIVGLGIGVWFAYNNFFSSTASLRKADAMWDSGVSAKRNEAVVQYKRILQQKDFWNPELNSLQQDRDRLYRRIIQHHVVFDSNRDDARDWIKNAFDEQFTLRDMNFGNEEVKQMWNEVVSNLKRKNGPAPRRENQSPFQSIPGLLPCP